MEAKNADLSGLRITRATDSAASRGTPRWVTIGLPAAGVVVLAVNFSGFSELGFGFTLSPWVIAFALLFALGWAWPGASSRRCGRRA